MLPRHSNIYARLLAILLLLAANVCTAQNLYKKVSINVKKMPLKDVLAKVGKQGDFYFSYNSKLVKNDSLVTLNASNNTVKEVLDMLFAGRFQYKETDNHVILQPAETEKWYYVTGRIIDELSGAGVSDASVFERNLLASTLSGADGFYKLRIKENDKYALAHITVSRGFYNDTSFTVVPGNDQQQDVQLTPTNHTLDTFVLSPYGKIEKSWLGRYMLSERLKKQSANLGKFFVDKPVQFSLTPGLGSHGKLSGQVTNKFSFNLLGGYAAGVNGFELGGLFNIDKKDVQYVQIAGIFNVVSGAATGVQVAGIVNKVSDSLSGVQVSGISGSVNGEIKGIAIAGISSATRSVVKGIQVSGVVNHVLNNDTAKRGEGKLAMKGIQITGVHNMVLGHVRGMQISGVSNTVKGNAKGVQIAGACNNTTGGFRGWQLSIWNYARKVEGLQVGLINISDTMNGYSIGFINIARKGYHNVSVSNSELLDVQLSYKAGNRKLYSILCVGGNTGPRNKAFMYGYGIGRESVLTKWLSISTDFTAMSLHLGNMAQQPYLFRVEPTVDIHPTRWLAVFAGPSFSFCPSLPVVAGADYMQDITTDDIYKTTPWKNTAGWVGWKFGIRLF